MINTIIVEDDVNASSILEIMLDSVTQEINIMAICDTVESAIFSIDKLQPDLVFLDVNLPDGLGFDVLKKCHYDTFKVIFTTIESDYALQAFEFSALHYLIKPLQLESLQTALNRFQELNYIHEQKEIIQLANSSVSNQIEKLMLYSNGSYSIYDLKDIIRFEAESNYTLVYIKPSLKIMVSKNIQFYENLLIKEQFARVHNSHLINLKHIKKINKGKYNKVLMTDNIEITVSKSKKEDFEAKIKNHMYFG